MTSLSEVYELDGGPDLRRLYLGVGLFLVGAVLVVLGIVVATTDLLRGGMTLAQVRELGGILGGVGVPAVFVGILTVLPAQRRTRVAAGLGAVVALVGVAMFQYAYPCQWSGSNCGAGLANLTLPTVGVYFVGCLITFWYLFVGVATFKTRNDPGGTARVDVVKRGETRVVEVERSRTGLGGIGFLGNTPDGEVETQTNSPDGGTGTGGGGGWARSETSAPVSDGGASTESIQSFDDADVERASDARPSGPTGDAYCGTCAHFEYVRTDDGIQPYCTYHEDLMDDMDACESWQSKA